MASTISHARKPVPTAESHRRNRADHAAETAEDYVEAIADTIDAEGIGHHVSLLALHRFQVAIKKSGFKKLAFKELHKTQHEA
jgi:hypothetical protein